MPVSWQKSACTAQTCSASKVCTLHTDLIISTGCTGRRTADGCRTGRRSASPSWRSLRSLRCQHCLAPRLTTGPTARAPRWRPTATCPRCCGRCPRPRTGRASCSWWRTPPRGTLACHYTELGMYFLNFFNNKKWFFCIFFKVNITYFCTSPI